MTFRYEGGAGKSGGSCLAALVIIACTSWAAASIFRLRLNWSVITVAPKVLVDVMESSPAMVENCLSKGVATDDAIVSGLAPGRFTVTRMVGKSTLGRSLTGSRRYPTRPKKKMASMTRVVVTGRRMKNSEMFMSLFPNRRRCPLFLLLLPARAGAGRRSRPPRRGRAPCR